MNEKSLSILLIDHEVEDFLLIEKLLKFTHFKTSTLLSAPSTEEGIQKISQQHFDLILIDIAKANHHLETITNFCERGKGIPIIVIGNQDDDDELVLNAIALGVQDYLTKNQIDAHLLEKSIIYAIERQHIQENLRELSLTDELTGLYNRRGFLQLAQQQISYSQRHHQGFLLFSIDINFFKEINDMHGHAIGDLALIDLANCLKKSFRKYDIVARIGGDEFAVIAVNTDQRGALIEHLIENTNSLAKRPYNLSLSVGEIYFDPSHPMELEELLKKVDHNLYLQKKEAHKK